MCIRDRLNTYTKIIGDEIGRLNDQVEKILNITRLEKRQIEMHKEEVPANGIIDKVIQNLAHMEFEKEVVIDKNLTAENDIIAADKTHFTNVICNIIENGIKYSPSNAEIMVTTKNVGKKLEISISDKGEGIDKKEIKKIFDKFYRIPKGDTHNVKGFGLGLFLSLIHIS